MTMAWDEKSARLRRASEKAAQAKELLEAALQELNGCRGYTKSADRIAKLWTMVAGLEMHLEDKADGY